MSGTGVYVSPYDRFWSRLVYKRSGPLGLVVRILLRLVAVEIPRATKVRPGLKLLHVGTGHTIHRTVEFGADVTLGPAVKIGKADPWNPKSDGMRLVIGDGAFIGAGAAVMARGDQALFIGEGAVVGTNAVVTKDVGSWEVWAGAPARRVGARPELELRMALRRAAIKLGEAGEPTEALGDEERGWWLASSPGGDTLALTSDGRPLITSGGRWRRCTTAAEMQRLAEAVDDRLTFGALA